MAASLVLTTFLLTAPAEAEKALVRPFESWGNRTPASEIDVVVFGRLKQLGIRPARLCSDEVFLRRVYLDVIGTLPTPQETRQFISDESPDKRAALIDRLFERDEFAAYWAMRWCDLLRVKSEFPINLWPNAVQAYHRWIRTSIRSNMPYDRFVREMLTSTGSNFRVPQVNFYRSMQSEQPEAIAQAVALTFMGTRAEKWPKDRLAGMAAFFSKIGYKKTAEWKEEIVFFDSLGMSEGVKDRASAEAVFPDGTPASLPTGTDPRQVFTDWLISPDNPWFARNIVNRLWCWLQGRGIIHEPDDVRPDNPPANPELLALIERELIESDYDIQHVMRLILNSKTYQLSSIPRSDHAEAEAQFAYYPLRRLEAEVLIDALCQITGTTEKYVSPIPEPFTYIPEDQRSIALADGSITSSFLEMFGRPPRDTGMQSERNNRPTNAQRLHLLNSSHIEQKIERSEKLRQLISSGKTPRESLTRLYLAILSRRPTEEELEAVGAYAKSDGMTPRNVSIDLVWALINSPEFLYRH